VALLDLDRLHNLDLASSQDLGSLHRLELDLGSQHKFSPVLVSQHKLDLGSSQDLGSLHKLGLDSSQGLGSLHSLVLNKRLDQCWVLLDSHAS